MVLYQSTTIAGGVLGPSSLWRSNPFIIQVFETPLLFFTVFVIFIICMVFVVFIILRVFEVYSIFEDFSVVFTVGLHRRFMDLAVRMQNATVIFFAMPLFVRIVRGASRAKPAWESPQRLQKACVGGSLWGLLLLKDWKKWSRARPRAAIGLCWLLSASRWRSCEGLIAASLTRIDLSSKGTVLSFEEISGLGYGLLAKQSERKWKNRKKRRRADGVLSCWSCGFIPRLLI